MDNNYIAVVQNTDKVTVSFRRLKDFKVELVNQEISEEVEAEY